MEYKNLQKQAKDLGLPYVGVSAEELEKSIQVSQSKEPEASKVEGAKATSKPKNKANTAIVLEGHREVRRYEASVHGKDFEELAREFAGKRGYTVSVENLEAGVVCPKCGAKLNPKKLFA